MKNCGSGMGCWYDSQTKALDGNPGEPEGPFDSTYDGYGGKAKFADGSIIFIIDIGSWGIGSCPAIAMGSITSLCGMMFN